jgi:hypothetical protein
VVVHDPVEEPDYSIADQRPPAAAHVDAQGAGRDLDAQGIADEDDHRRWILRDAKWPRDDPVKVTYCATAPEDR